MLLRSLRIVHFRGIADLHVKHLGESGVQSVALPAGTDPSTLAEALRFAFLGRTTRPTPWISAGEGFVFVEVAFRTRDGGTASVFRGADRRGASQVSLREGDGARISSGAEEVRARLAELVAAQVDSWASATFLGDPASAEDPAAAPSDAAPPARRSAPGAVATERALSDPSPPADLGGAVAAALGAVERMRRSLRAAALASEAGSALRELVALDRRLHGERAAVARALERMRGGRGPATAVDAPPGDATRTQATVRPAPARDPGTGSVPAPAPGDPARSGPIPAWVETSLGTAALAALGALLLWASSPEVRSDRGLGAILTAVFLAGTGSCAWVAWRRRSSDPGAAGAEEPVPGTTAVRPASDARDASPVRASGPDARPVPVREADLPRLQARLEEVDGALAQVEVAVRRAALLVGGMPTAAGSGGEAAVGGPGGRLAAGETPSTVRAAAADLADRICRQSVERDALLARDAAPPRAAARGVEAAFARLARIAGDESLGAAALARHGATPDALEAAASVDPDALAQALRDEVERLGATPAGGRALGAERTPAAPRVRELAGVAAGGAPAVAGSSPPTVPSRGAPAGRTREDPRRPDPSAVRASDDPGARERAWLAARLRRGDALSPGPGDHGAMVPARAVVLDRRPASLPTDADLAAFVAAESPRTTQIVVGSS